MKNIYKDEVIGNINSNLIYNNEIKGVFGEIIDISPVPRDDGTEPGSPDGIPNVITSVQRLDNYNYEYIVVTPAYDSTSSGITFRGGQADTKHNLNYNFNFNFVYSTPFRDTDNVIISAKLYYKRKYYRATSVTQTNWAVEISEDMRAFIVANPNSFQSNVLLGTIFPTPTIRPQAISQISETVNSIDFNISELTKTNFSISFNAVMNKILSGTINTSLVITSISYSTDTTLDIYEPQYIEVIIRGDTYRITPQAFQYGSKENAFEQPQSTLLTTKATYKGQPLWEHIGQRIVNKWYNGKQVVSLSTIINDESDIKEVGEETYVFRVRRGEIDESNANQVNNASIFKTVDGIAKKFIIVNITNNYDGSMNQSLDLQEVT